MSSEVEFQPFQKIARLNRLCTITEKIDGTNAQVIVDAAGNVFAASRSRLITPEQDNFGFAAWVAKNVDELRKLGEGRHFGEWWGLGVQRGYGLHERRFSLFNTSKWANDDERPACCSVVPTLYSGPFSTAVASEQIARLTADGSLASPGFMKPEGIVVWHEAARQYFKVTCEKDEAPKGVAA